MTASDKVLRARGRLTAENPFFSLLILTLELREDPACPTGWTDGRVIAYRPEWIDSIHPTEVIGFLAHEVMHLALLHHLRRGNRSRLFWNLAGDLVINAILKDEGFHLPGDSGNEEFLNVSTEEVYEWLRRGLIPGPPTPPLDVWGDSLAGKKPSPFAGDDAAQKKSKQAVSMVKGINKELVLRAGKFLDGEGPEDGPPADPGRCGEVRDMTGENGESLSGPGRERAEGEWMKSLQRAISLNQGDISLRIERSLNHTSSPRIDWISVLARFLRERTKADYSWKQPNPRYAASGMYVPALVRVKTGQVVVVADTSGSVSDADLESLFSEYYGIAAGQDIDVTLVCADCAVTDFETVDYPGRPEIRKAKGGGGTDYRPAFEWVERSGIDPICLIYLTDGWCSRFPITEPDYPVLWAIGGKNARRKFTPPWGEIVRML